MSSSNSSLDSLVDELIRQAPLVKTTPEVTQSTHDTTASARPTISRRNSQLPALTIQYPGLIDETPKEKWSVTNIHITPLSPSRENSFARRSSIDSLPSFQKQGSHVRRGSLPAMGSFTGNLPAIRMTGDYMESAQSEDDIQ